MWRRWLVGVVSCLAAVAAAGPGAVAAGPSRSEFCAVQHLKCFHVTVPLDHSNTVPGKISLWVQEYVPAGVASRGVVFLLAGGPGQASTSEFFVDPYGYWARMFPGYTIVTFDPRGTGLSDPLTCRAASIAACAAELGPRRDYYGTVDNAMDLDAVRNAVGAQHIVIYGASYGTDLATTYARMYPSHTTRLLLDSVASPFTALPLVAGIVKQLPATLGRFCSHWCTSATRGYPDDAVALARLVATKPLKGRVLQPGDRYVHVAIDESDLLNLLIDTDLYTGIAAELPAAVVAAHGGHLEPLLRLEQAVNPAPELPRPFDTTSYNAVYLATLCDDGPFPWTPDTPISARPALATAALGQLSPGAFGPIGQAASIFGSTTYCATWPVSTVQPPAVPATYPNIPVLAVSGDFDLRSPTFEDRALLAHFPRGQLLTVQNSGHAPIADRMSQCLLGAVRTWMSGRKAPATCAEPLLLKPIGAFPAGKATTTGAAGTLTSTVDTLRDAEASWALTRADIAGVAAGKLTVSDTGFGLSGYSLGGGVDLSGSVDVDYGGDRPWTFGGVVHVVEHGTTVGVLALQPDGTLDGSLDGESVTANRILHPVAPSTLKPLPNWSDWTPPAGSPDRVAGEIAAHIGASYRLSAGGPPLLRAASTPPGSDRLVHGHPVFAFELRHAFSELVHPAQYLLTSSTWAYTLCGAASHCAIPGTPTVPRGQLVRREALELALYTFEFEPSVSSVVILLPPPDTDTAAATALYYTRSDLAAALRHPLAGTLPLATPPLPTDPDRAETETLTRLTLRHLYGLRITLHGSFGAELVLNPEF